MELSPTSDRLRRLASALTPEWLAAQRWYRGKSRHLTSVELLDAGRIGGSAGWLVVLEATEDTEGRARYLVPAALDGDRFREPLDGEGVWRALATLMLDGGELAGDRGRWLFTPTGVVSDLRGPAAKLPERRLGVQQSNTSVALGDDLMLKVYRLVEPAPNPEVEMNASDRVGFRDAPTLAGSATYLLAVSPFGSHAPGARAFGRRCLELGARSPRVGAGRAS